MGFAPYLDPVNPIRSVILSITLPLLAFESSRLIPPPHWGVRHGAVKSTCARKNPAKAAT